jgi:ribonucleoside-diphosphate reductase alpha chain
VEDIEEVYMRAWKGGSEVRGGLPQTSCKLSQPINDQHRRRTASREKALTWGQRKLLPTTRDSKTHRFVVGGQEGYITVSAFPDSGKRGRAVHPHLQGRVDALRHPRCLGHRRLDGAPVRYLPSTSLKDKYIDMKFDPAGITDDPDIRFAKSIPDYIFRWLDLTYGEKLDEINTVSVVPLVMKEQKMSASYDGPPCNKCGNMTKRAGSCYCCTACGQTTGCS